jgi:hypothetical protein
VRTAEIRIIAVAGGARAGEVIADLAGNTPGGRLVVSDRGPVRDRGAAAGATTASLNWLLGPLPAGG